MGGIEAVSGRSLADVRDHSVLQSPVSPPQPKAADWSGQLTTAEIIHARQCGGRGHCAYPSMCQGIQDGEGR